MPVPGGEIGVSVGIENSGPHDGDEVVQLYTRAITPGVYEIMVGASSADIRATGRVTLKN